MSDQRLEAGDYRRGPGGRPTREEAERRHQILLKTVFRLFSEKGWDGTSIDEIARQSGVAKTFIYARYPDKTALLVGAIERLMAEALGTLQLSEPLADNIEEGLVAFGKKLLDMALQPEALAFRRQFFAEVDRFPELARAFLERNPLLDRMAEFLTNYANRGDIVLSDARTTAEHFAVLVVGIPRAIATLVGREPPAQEDRRLRAAVRLFLNGCRPRA
jgi:TetR/AcrR family transcriptional regulator, mexJK operon transcriptional repressor